MLVVFNHPWWDLADVGAETHTAMLYHFLRAHRDRLHALELNGYRSQAENDRVRMLAAEAELPVISGGDRHGCAPNALLNLTTATTFAEFADEVRDGCSRVLIMPEYRQHLLLRTLASASRRHGPLSLAARPAALDRSGLLRSRRGEVRSRTCGRAAAPSGCGRRCGCCTS